MEMRTSSARGETRGEPIPHSTSTQALSEGYLEGVNHQAIDVSDIENDDTLDEVIMAIDLTPHGTLGCCYYIARDEKLYFMEDLEFGDVEIIDSCK